MSRPGPGGGFAGRIAASAARARDWSAIEYAAHSRDVLALRAYGADEPLTRDEPTFPLQGFVIGVAWK